MTNINELYEQGMITTLEIKQEKKESMNEILAWLKDSRKIWEKQNNMEMMRFTSELTCAVINTEIALRRVMK